MLLKKWIRLYQQEPRLTPLTPIQKLGTRVCTTAAPTLNLTSLAFSLPLLVRSLRLITFIPDSDSIDW